MTSPGSSRGRRLVLMALENVQEEEGENNKSNNTSNKNSNSQQHQSAVLPRKSEQHQSAELSSESVSSQSTKKKLASSKENDQQPLPVLSNESVLPQMVAKKIEKTARRKLVFKQPADMPLSEIENTLGLHNWDSTLNQVIAESTQRMDDSSYTQETGVLNNGNEFLNSVDYLLEEQQPSAVLSSCEGTPLLMNDKESTFTFLTPVPLINDVLTESLYREDFLEADGNNNYAQLDDTGMLQSYGSGDDLFQDQDTCLSVAGAQEITPTSDLSTYNIASSFPTSESETTLLETAGDSTLDMQVVVETDPVSAGAVVSDAEMTSETVRDSTLDMPIDVETDPSACAVLNDAVHEDGGEDDVMDELPRFGPEPKPKTKQQLKFENKDRREHGDEYKNYKGVVVPKKKPKLIECKCQFPSCRTLTEEETSSIHEAYWELGNYSRQRDFINNCIKSVPVKRHSTGAAKPRENSYEYYFRVPRGEDNREDTDIRVCRAKFLGTLDIGKKTLVCTKKNETNGFSKKDQRGKHAPKHKLSEQQHSAVVEHISSFPRVESHYCRQSSSFEYLDQKLTIRLMHKLYKLVHDTRLHVGYETYRRVFKKDFHLSFHKPKKDQCSTCAAFKNLTDEQKSLGREEYARHLQNKELAQKEKNAHKEEALRNDSFKSFSFDLQSVLYTPCSEVSSFYYSRKLNSYNFTIYDQATRDGVCYFWDETEGERGTCEIGTALWTHLLTLPANVKKVSFFSDCCGGQNRNRFIAALLLHAVRVLHFEQIDHCFLESGHTHMEVDSMHSCIEQAKRGREVYCPSEWIPIIRSARGFSKTKGANPLTIKPYSVKVLTHDKILDIKDLRSNIILSPLEKNTEGENVNWLHIKRLMYKKAKPESIFYKNNYTEDNFMEMQAPFKKPTSSQKKRGRPPGRKSSPAAACTTTNFNYEFLHPYPSRLGVSLQKKKDLIKLCRDNLIPSDFHAYYENLPCSGEQTIERLPQPDVREDDEDGPALRSEDCCESDND